MSVSSRRIGGVWLESSSVMLLDQVGERLGELESRIEELEQERDDLQHELEIARAAIAKATGGES
jgi:chaperonin cofactor prefoldin